MTDAPDNARCRARDLGITIGNYRTGPLNAITDVAGVEVGHATVSWGDADLPDRTDRPAPVSPRSGRGATTPAVATMTC